MKNLISTLLLMAVLSISLFAGDTPGGNRNGGGDPCPTCSTAPPTGNSTSSSNSVLDAVIAFLSTLLP